jgi:hypothetical protein
LSKISKSHKETVERSMKLATDVSKAVYGFHAQDGLIRASVHCKSMMSQFGSKKDFSLME